MGGVMTFESQGTNAIRKEREPQSQEIPPQYDSAHQLRGSESPPFASAGRYDDPKARCRGYGSLQSTSELFLRRSLIHIPGSQFARHSGGLTRPGRCSTSSLLLDL